MAGRYTPGKASSMFSDWLKPYMMEYQRKQEEREYKAPLGERNVGILNAILAGAKTVKGINEALIASKERKKKEHIKRVLGLRQEEFKKLETEEDIYELIPDEPIKDEDIGQLSEITDIPEFGTPPPIKALGGPVRKYEIGGKVKKYQYGGIPGEEVNVTAPRREGLTSLDIRRQPDTNSMFEPVKLGAVVPSDTSFKGQDLYGALGIGGKQMESIGKVGAGIKKVSEVGQEAYGEASSALSSAQVLGSKETDPFERGVAIYDLAEQGERGVRAGIKGAKAIASKLMKKKATEKVAEEGAKSVLGKLAPGVSVGTGIHKMATADTTAGKISGGLETAGGVADLVPGIGTTIGLGFKGLSAGVDMFAGTKPKKQRHIARWG